MRTFHSHDDEKILLLIQKLVNAQSRNEVIELVNELERTRFHQYQQN